MKKIISRDQFEEILNSNASEMAKDEELINEALKIKVKAGYDYFGYPNKNGLVNQYSISLKICSQFKKLFMPLSQVFY